MATEHASKALKGLADLIDMWWWLRLASAVRPYRDEERELCHGE
ncbi:hypothetical protein ACW5WN_01130 [Aeromonas lacus]|nr:hypothetical protein [Aeromonas lacus]